MPNLRRFIPGIIWDWFIKPLGIPVAGGVAVLVWHVLQDEWGPTTLVLSAGMVAAVFVILDRLTAWIKSSARSAPHNQRPEKVAQIVSSWLSNHGFPAALDPNPKSDIEFWINGRDRQNRPFNVYMEKIHPDVLQVTMGIGMTDKDIAVINKARLGEETAEGIVLEMARLGIPYQDLKWPIKTVPLGVTVALDETFTRARLLEEITRLKMGAIVAVVTGQLYVRRATQATRRS